MARTEAGLAVERAFPAGMASVRFEIEGVLSLISEAGAKTAGLHHLVLHSLQRTAGKAAWVAFNDYCIAETPGETALDFTQPWRTPVCLVYRNCSVPDETPGETVGETVGETPEETVGEGEGSAENAREPREEKRGEPKDPSDAEKKKEKEKEEEENAESVAQSKENTETASTTQSTIQPTSTSTSTTQSTTQSAAASLPSVPRSLPISLPPPLPSLPSSSSSSSSSQPFYTPISLQSASPAYRRLSPAELPGAGDLVAIDCEFVALNCEEVPPFPLFLSILGGSSARRPSNREKGGQSPARPRHLPHQRSPRRSRRLHSLRGPRRRLPQPLQRTFPRGSRRGDQPASPRAAQRRVFPAPPPRRPRVCVRRTRP